MIFFDFLRFLALISAIFSFLVWTAFLRILFGYGEFSQRWVDFCAKIHSRLGFFILLVDRRHTATPTSQLRPSLMVSNHLSYLDVLTISADYACSFVTSVEIRDSFLLGHMAKLFGCVFVERRDRSQIDKEIGSIAESIKNGRTVCIFPEATSSNGEQVLPFKKSMFKSVSGTGIPVHAFSLKYSHKKGGPLNSQERDAVCWYGDMPFLPHLWACIRLRGFLSSYEDLGYIETTDLSRDELCETAFAKVSAKYHNILL